MPLKGILRSALSGLVVLVLLPWAIAQQSDQKGSNTDGTSSRAGTTRLPAARPPSDSPRPLRPWQQVLIITGRVVQEDGAPVPLGVVIERSCGARARREANVDSSGNFMFEIGGNSLGNGLIPDASDDTIGGMDTFSNRTSQAIAMPLGTGVMSSANLAGCELRARLVGYRSSAVILDGQQTVGQIDVGTIVLQPIAKVPGTLISVTNMQAPKAAKKALERAQKASQKKHFEEAEKDLKTAVGLYPRYAAAWFALGQSYRQQQRNQDARMAYTEAIAADSMYVNPYIQLAMLSGLEQKWQEVAEFTDRALSLDPLDFPEGYFYNSLAYYSMNKLDIAERSARKALRLDSLHRIPQVHLILANILKQKQDIPGSAEQLRNFLKFAPNNARAEQVRTQLQELEKSPEALASKGPEHP